MARLKDALSGMLVFLFVVMSELFWQNRTDKERMTGKINRWLFFIQKNGCWIKYLKKRAVTIQRYIKILKNDQTVFHSICIYLLNSHVIKQTQSRFIFLTNLFAEDFLLYSINGWLFWIRFAFPYEFLYIQKFISNLWHNYWINIMQSKPN